MTTNQDLNIIRFVKMPKGKEFWPTSPSEEIFSITNPLIFAFFSDELQVPSNQIYGYHEIASCDIDNYLTKIKGLLHNEFMLAPSLSAKIQAENTVQHKPAVEETIRFLETIKDVDLSNDTLLIVYIRAYPPGFLT